uniref:Uncharacterized protein n=1 Tax=Arundo donax TaxID=35708 RepID=A0A0A8XWJ2_ARUDO
MAVFYLLNIDNKFLEPVLYLFQMLLICGCISFFSLCNGTYALWVAEIRCLIRQ